MNKTLLLLLFMFFAVLIWSAVNHFDYFTWFLEAIPAILALAILALTFKRFRFTNMTYIFIFIHCCILLVGAKYTYAEVPLFNYIQEYFGHARNNYDKVGHFAQGFIPAIVARELLIRLNVLNKKSWLPFIVISICLSISALYELFEWCVAALTGQSAEDFLGTQGYEWDAQSDMLFATIGAICALLFLSKIQDRAMKKIMQIILFTAILMGCRMMSPELLYKSGAGTLYFPTYDEERVKYHIDSYGSRIIGMAPIQPNDSLSQFTNKWYSKHLYSLREPVLYNKTDKSINIIRFTHLGTWGNPYSYRIEQRESDISITYNKTNGSGGYNTGKRIEHGTKKIDVEKWNLVISKMQSIDFWNIGTHDENMILDGEEWVFEAVVNGHYHFITRTSPDVYDGKEYAELCSFIIQIYKQLQ